MKVSPFRIAAILGTSALLLPLAGCRGQRQVADDTVPPFVFRSLDLRQQDRQGRPGWELTSPEARYDLRRRVARALTPHGVIYADGKPLYRLRADSGTVLNDGEVVLLEGKVRMERYGEDPVLIQAPQVRWLPRQGVMTFDQNPEVFDRNSRLTARRARFLIERDEVALSGEPRLQRWSQHFNPFRSPPTGPPEVNLEVHTATWQPRTGLLVAPGPVRATRRPADRKAAAPPQILTAQDLRGNTRSQRFELLAPVSFADPQERIRLSAGTLRFDGRQETIQSTQEFRGSRGELQVEGREVEVNLKDHTVTIGAGCQLLRPGESLRADRCRWNWQTQQVGASGSLEVRRQANRQLTRGGELRGRLGPAGELEVFSPGGRVISQFQVPPVRRPLLPRPVAHRKPDPIRL